MEIILTLLPQIITRGINSWFLKQNREQVHLLHDA